jgi:hypothetical protein
MKPGAGTKAILEQTTNETDNLLSCDFVILSCDSNNIGRVILSEAFSDIIGFIKRVTHTKVILVRVPVRHDLEGTNCSINKEITKFNKKLCKLGKLFSHLSVPEIEENRHYYTKHGFHLNGLGKKIVTLNLGLLIFSRIKKASNLSISNIPLEYYEAQYQITSCSTVNHTLPQSTVESMKIKHVRKKPVTKTNNFLWES